MGGEKDRKGEKKKKKKKEKKEKKKKKEFGFPTKNPPFEYRYNFLL